MHIGFLSIESPFDASGGGGIAAYLRASIPALVEAGHRVTVIAQARKTGIQQTHQGAVRIVHIALPNLHWYLDKLPGCTQTIVLPLRQLEWSYKFYKVACQIFQDDPPDVLESAETGAFWLARYPVAPLVIRLHGSTYVFRKYSGETLNLGARWNHGLEQIIYRQVAAVTSPSRFQAAEIAQEMGWPPDRIRIIPNPIVPEMWAEARQNECLINTNHRRPVILYTGRLAPVKGIQPLLEAAKKVKETIPEAQFVLAGSWQMPEKPERWGLSEGTVNRHGVLWLGHVPWQKLKEWYRQAAIFVMPSYYETFGISCLEAMAFSLPIVATTVGGLPEVVEDGVTGLLVSPGNAQVLAEAILRLLRNPVLCQHMGHAGQERVLAEFMVSKVLDQTLMIYQQARKR